tara:strand:+ start:1785 stop:2066 length:282 start_codon:yes stop_codon:yes gene_type:complete
VERVTLAQGGVGKSTLIELLIQYWRSEGLEVVVTASSGKAARLIGGVTVHRAFGLNVRSGIFQRANIENEVGSDRFILLARADIIIIDGECCT